MEEISIETSSISLLKAADVAIILNISKAFAYRLLQTGEIRSVRIKRARRVRPKDLEDYIDANVEAPNRF